MEEGEISSDLKVEACSTARATDGVSIIGKIENADVGVEEADANEDSAAEMTMQNGDATGVVSGNANGDVNSDLNVASLIDVENGDGAPADTPGSDSWRRRSTRMRKEPTPLIQEMPGPSKSTGTGNTRYRFFRPPPRVYKPSALVDRVWSIQEREKLLDAVSKVAVDDYASIADIIGNTRSPAEVRDYLKRIQAKSKELEGQRYSALFDEKRHPHSRHLLVKEEGEAIERWLRVIDHLVSDNDTTDYSKSIPDVFAVIANLEQNPDPGTINRKRKKQEESESSASSNKTGENNTGEDDEDDDSVAPVNYKIIYQYLYALLRGIKPPALDPIESWVVLDLISDTATELKGSDLEAQKDYLRCIYRDYCSKTLNMKWCNTSKMIVPITEEIAVVSKRRKMEAQFSGYLSKKDKERVEGAGDGIETGLGDKESTSLNLKTASPNETSSSTHDAAFDPYPCNQPSTSSATISHISSTSSDIPVNGDLKPDLSNGHSNEGPSEIHPLAIFKDEPTYHNIMIGGLNVTKDAEDLGSFFTMNPLGVPVSLLNPKMNSRNSEQN